MLHKFKSQNNYFRNIKIKKLNIKIVENHKVLYLRLTHGLKK